MKDFLKSLILSKVDLIGAPRGFSFSYSKNKELIMNMYSIMEENGFVEVLTPTFDFLEVYEKTLGSGSKELFVFKDGNDLIVPRYDITTQIVRFLAPRIKYLQLPIKLFYYGDVFREPEFKWYTRQLKQFGAEIIGGTTNELRGLLRVMKKLIEVLREFKKISNYKLVVNYSSVISNLLSLVREEDRDIVKYLISKKDIPTLERIDIPDLAKKKIIEAIEISLFGDDHKLKEILHSLIKREEVEELEFISENFELVIDPTLIPSMEYYSGIFFLVYSSDSSLPLASGGRYDNLTSKFGYKQTAMGFAIDLD
ncbi:MAG: ATP phosphoribosyltransferase regulatory subunit [Brevinematia bacterium]